MLFQYFTKYWHILLTGHLQLQQAKLGSSVEDVVELIVWSVLIYCFKHHTGDDPMTLSLHLHTCVSARGAVENRNRREQAENEATAQFNLLPLLTSK